MALEIDERDRTLIELARIDLDLSYLCADTEGIPNHLETVHDIASECYVNCFEVDESIGLSAYLEADGVNRNELDFNSDDSIKDSDCNPKDKDTVEKSKIQKRSLDGPHTRKKRRERTVKRNTGEAYVTAKGRDIKKRQLKDLPVCRTKCRENIPEDVRKAILEEYWALGSRIMRISYIANHSETTETAVKRRRTTDPTKSRNRKVSHRFYFKINGQKVKICRGCFMKTLGETQMFVTLALANSISSISGVMYSDKRGHHEPKNKHGVNTISEVINHIKSFFACESHHTIRQNNERYLPTFLTLKKMYELYCINREIKVSRRIYETEFHKLNLAFKRPKVSQI